MMKKLLLSGNKEWTIAELGKEDKTSEFHHTMSVAAYDITIYKYRCGHRTRQTIGTVKVSVAYENLRARFLKATPTTGNFRLLNIFLK